MLSIIGFVILIVSVSVHEAAHAFAADRLSDPTPRANGRLTLNPLAHADPIGTFLLPLFLILSGSPVFFAWAKPVPVDPYNLRHPRRDEAILAASGPLSNLCLAFSFSAFASIFGGSSLTALATIINLSLAIFNLIPLFPLDGSKILLGLLPTEKALAWEEALRHYSLAILIFLLLPLGGTSFVSRFLSPLIGHLFQLIYPLSPGFGFV